MMEMNMTPEVSWLAVGLLLLGLEMLTGTFVVLFFAVGGFATAALVWTGVIESLTSQIFMFTILSASGLFVFKDKLQRSWGNKSQNIEGDVGASLQLEQELLPQGQCEVSYQGTKWIAINESGRSLHKGEWVKIARTDGVKLILK